MNCSNLICMQAIMVLKMSSDDRVLNPNLITYIWLPFCESDKV